MQWSNYLVITNDYIIERNFYYYPMNTVIEEICGKHMEELGYQKEVL